MADIDVGRLTAAARALMLAGLWTQAAGLIEDVTAANPAERAVLAVAQAEVAVNQEFHRLTHDYADELFGTDGDVPQFGPPGRDPEVIGRLAARAASLRASAPDQGRAAAATFYAGLIEDNLRGDGEAARSMFAAALTAAEEARDDLTTSEALRHLGYHLSEAGDAGRARQMWERSTEQRQRAGAVPYVLSQQLLLAGLARDTGDPDTARTVAREVGRWARALGITILEPQAAEMAGAPGSGDS
jgi:hypothetical protein